MNRLLKPEEVRQILGISQATRYAWMQTKNKSIKPATKEIFIFKKYIKPSKIARQFPLYDELLKLSRNGHPTLLYGKDSYYRKHLIRDIHSSNQGDLLYDYEYVGREAKFKDSDILCKEMERAIKGRNDKRVYELLRDYRDTKRTFRRIDCGHKDSETVFKELTETTIFTQGKMMNHLSSLDINRPNGFKACFNINPKPLNYFPPHHYEDCGALLRRGVLFIDNLRCNPNNPKDWDWYDKLARYIEKRRINDPIYGGWLVAYVDDLEAFPKSVINQFKHLPPDGETKKGKDKKDIVQTQTGKKLSNSLEYIRLDDNDDMFYAKVKGKDREERNPLELTGQPLNILHCLFNKYDSGKKKASVPIDAVLYEAGIKEHKKGDNISKDKRGHLSTKITPIKDELDIAGFDRDRIKIDGEYCELDIECRYDI